MYAGPCTCWPAGGPPCPEHGTIRADVHHWHGSHYGDPECCICCDSPCPPVSVEDMRLHRWYDIEHERQRMSRTEADSAPF